MKKAREYIEKGRMICCTPIAQAWIIYGVLLGIYVYALLFESEFGWGRVLVVLVYLIMLPVMANLLAYMNNVSWLKKNQYYRPQFNTKNKIRNWRDSSVSSCGVKLLMVLISPIVMLVAALVLDRFVKSLFDVSLSTLMIEWNLVKITFGDRDAIAVVSAIYAVFIAGIPVINMYVKNKCLLFEFDEIPSVKLFTRLFWGSVICLLIWGISDYLIIHFTINNLIWICNISFIMWAFILIVDVILFVYIWSPLNKFEKKILNQVDELYWNRTLYVIPCKTWYKSQIIVVLGRFLKQYYRNARRAFSDIIVDVEFGNIYVENKVNDLLSKKKGRSVVIVISVLGVVSVLGFLTSQGEASAFFGIMAGMIVPYWVIFLGVKSEKPMYRWYRSFFSYSWGYYVKTTKSVKYVSAYDSKYTLYGRTLKSLRKIVSFYNLSLHMQYYDIEEEKIGAWCIEGMVDYLGEIKKQKSADALIIPILVCFCLNFNRNKERVIKNKRLEEYIEQMHLCKREKDLISKIVLLVLRDLTGDDKLYQLEEAGYKKIIGMYLEIE